MTQAIPVPRSGTPIDLASQWVRLLEAEPRLRIREAARRLGVSELALLQCRPAESAIPLQGDFPALMAELETVGEVMTLARNHAVVHEVTGCYRDFHTSSSGAMGLAVGEIDVRVFFRHWQYGYRVLEQTRSGRRESLQFFDPHGTAIQKVYRTANTQAQAWETLLQRYATLEASPPPIAPAAPAPKRARPDRIDVASLRKDWAALKDVHHFKALLKRHGCDRLTALELIGEDYAVRLDRADEQASPLVQLLGQVRDSECPIMSFVGNSGIVQIHTGTVQHLAPSGAWFNILDPGFNLHVDLNAIEQWWRVRRPTADTVITSLEGYDAEGTLVLTLFGARQPGHPEDPHWQQQMAELEASRCA